MSTHGCLTCCVCGRPCPICGTCSCPTEGVNDFYVPSKSMVPWLEKRLASIEAKMLESEANVPETIALSGQRTAYKQILHYAQTHGLA